jgi:hypothetical protein
MPIRSLPPSGFAVHLPHAQGGRPSEGGITRRLLAAGGHGDPPLWGMRYGRLREEKPHQVTPSGASHHLPPGPPKRRRLFGVVHPREAFVPFGSLR